MRPITQSSLLALALAASRAVADVSHYSSEQADAFNAGAFGLQPNTTYKSSDIVSPRFLINKFDVDKTAGGAYIFMSPVMGVWQNKTPFIFDSKDLSLVYADPTWDGGSDSRIQTANGTQYLTFWSGQSENGWGSGGGVVLDNTYAKIWNLTTVDLPTGADSHEFHFTGEATALLNNFRTITTDLSSIDGPSSGLLHDGGFQEVDIATNTLLYNWTATEHFSLNETYIPYSSDSGSSEGFDWFHMNALQKLPDGNYLISVRHLCLVALLDGSTGDKIWQVGGKLNDFEDLSGGRATNSCFQHDARLQDVDGSFTELTLFDNHAVQANQPTPGCHDSACTRGLRLKLDYDAMTAEVISEFYHPAGVSAHAEGGYQALPGGGAMMGWGTVPALTEFAADGTAVIDVQTSPWSTATDGGGSSLYRVYKYDWEGAPQSTPAMAVEDGVVYVSWNGATKVKQWLLRGGSDSASLKEVQVVTKQGFETGITPNTMPAVVQVDALDTDGNVLSTSDALDTASGQTVS